MKRINAGQQQVLLKVGQEINFAAKMFPSLNMHLIFSNRIKQRSYVNCFEIGSIFNRKNLINPPGGGRLGILACGVVKYTCTFIVTLYIVLSWIYFILLSWLRGTSVRL